MNISLFILNFSPFFVCSPGDDGSKHEDIVGTLQHKHFYNEGLYLGWCQPGFEADNRRDDGGPPEEFGKIQHQKSLKYSKKLKCEDKCHAIEDLFSMYFQITRIFIK